MNYLPFDFHRCAGQAVVTDTPNSNKKQLSLEPVCNDCRRREPGHATRQIYIAPAVNYGKCDNKIEPEA